MAKKHDYDAAWKTILEAFEKEIVELLFPEIYHKINWEIKSEALDNELLEIQKEIFSKEEAEKIISDKIIKVRMKDNECKILFIHVEVQSYSSSENVFAERMFRYFYRIWDKFRYKYKDNSDIVGSAIYTYKGSAGKDKKYIYKLSDLEDDILIYNFKTMDVEKLDLDFISDENPLKLVFKIAKRLLATNTNDKEIFLAKVELFNELINYNKVKTIDQRKALTYFLEYLFLIQDDNLSEKFKEIKDNTGGVIKMSIDEIREKYLEEKGKIEERLEIAKEMIKDNEPIEKIMKYSKLTKEEILKIKE
ncbi:Rpn family recombination-promoting nuclease/putative transposase [Clostridium gasigenes]|uniref:Rpn family recombination-promoting nuclease/putative transposase n=1 Tax=Clostridium gasigenes TaxID=94869 RepID=UPI001C0D6C28|nr:Rpn family recombination-promoting nuclease/putative transposase [Clostridium gasigenes]MBU3135574.1 Rpn family recombination-promoting nuclease/putative transposase [Clostridium gasigenes]